MKRLLLTGTLIIAAATFSFAVNPKGETKDTKVETPTEVKAQEESFTYYVTGETIISGQLYYTVSTASPVGGCPGGTKPCQVTSTEEKDGLNRISDDAVQSVNSHRANY